MGSMLARKVVSFASGYNPHLLSRIFSFCLKAYTTIPNKEDAAMSHSIPASDYSSSLHLSPLFSDSDHPSDGYNIELVDHDAWKVSSGVAEAWRGNREWGAPRVNSLGQEETDEPLDGHSSHVEDEPDFEDIDNMRIRGNLFYKLERSSKEYEEYSFEFHRKKSPKKRDEGKENAEERKKANSSPKEKFPKVHQVTNTRSVTPQLDDIEVNSVGNKRQRTPTFNQLTGPYHEPFCLDIFISNASVRACIVHRVTSKVVAVAHSISKDMKFDLTSTKNKTACAAVGAILSQRALADDIHDVIYTPRKGERLEGKLQIVLQSIIDNGINVKVKIKQRTPKKAVQPFMTKKHAHSVGFHGRENLNL